MKKQEIMEKIVNTSVENKLGQRFTIREFIDKGTLAKSLIRLDNDKLYSVDISFHNGFLKYEDEIAELLRIGFDEEKAAEEARKANEPKPAPVVSKTDTNVPSAIFGENTISCFRGENEFLSNMYPCPITYNGLIYQSSESAFQAQKDLSRSVEFTTITGRSAKSLGKRVTLRRDWEAVKVGIMTEIVRAKFTQNEDLKEKLLATGNKTLIEGNAWNDRFWGVCMGKGLNTLGRILMDIRKELKK